MLPCVLPVSYKRRSHFTTTLHQCHFELQEKRSLNSPENCKRIGWLVLQFYAENTPQTYFFCKIPLVEHEGKGATTQTPTEWIGVLHKLADDLNWCLEFCSIRE